MVKIEDHIIQESSSFYQGHPGQYFTSKNSTVVFKVHEIDINREKTLSFNSEKYSKSFEKEINKMLSQRLREGYGQELISKEDLKIIYPNFIDGMGDDGHSGSFYLSPNLFRCDLCGVTAPSKDWTNSRGCSCNRPRIKQITNVLFCDDCGKINELNYGSNLLSKCNCGDLFSSLIYTEKNNPITWKVKCNNCKNQKPLRFFNCKHQERREGENFTRSTLPPKRFRLALPRSGALTHPYVISIPKIKTEHRSSTNSQPISERQFSMAFHHFFSDIETTQEAHLSHPKFKDSLLSKEPFWNNELVYGPVEKISLSNEPTTWSNEDFLKFIEMYLNKIYLSVNQGLDRSLIEEKFNLSSFRESLLDASSIEYEEKDLQFSYLVNCDDDSIRKITNSEQLSILTNLGISEVNHYREMEIISALLGYTEGSSRRNPMLFSTFMTRQNTGKPKKPTVYVREFPTEGILFRLSAKAVLEWLVKNDIVQITFSKVKDPEKYMKSLLHMKENEDLDLDLIRSEIKKLVHTVCHLFMVQASEFTGLEIRSTSEILFENDLSFMIYSTDSINTGGIEYAFNHCLEKWNKRVRNVHNDCNQDPGCMVDEEGSCRACSYIPEFVCRHFNSDLDRDVLVGKNRYNYGFFRN